jgi:hypothetical protein
VSDEPLYVYGVVSAAERDTVAVAGVEGSQVRTVEFDGLAALTSPLQSESLRVAKEVRAHLRVLQDVAEEATVLPVRFGTVLEGEQAVRERLLQPNADRLISLLEQLQGCVQLTVKGDYDQDRFLKSVVAASPALSELAARVRTLPDAAGYYDRIRLGEAIADAVARQREHDSERARELLEPLAEAVRVEDASAEFQAFNLACLVRRTRQPEFTRAVQALSDEVREYVAVRYVGPLPAYSFTDTELEAA